ncbi:lactadherin-like [Patiria miniata]|uniref:F5/8 type C domain-containing protein n=1 Tax=Patiria miniata TaxID=46514 RepID=A0A914AAW0_PATMI|nr:lactadherin-like [Patiria miniata]
MEILNPQTLQLLRISRLVVVCYTTEIFRILDPFSVYHGNADGEVRSCNFYGRPPKPVPGESWMKTALREAYQRCNQQTYTGPTGCCNGKPLGMKDGSIPSSSITDLRHLVSWQTTKARLDGRRCWGFYLHNGYSWIQVDLGAMYSVSGLITKGHGVHWVTEYQVSYSFDGDNWSNVTEAGGTTNTSAEQVEAPKKFTGNIDGSSHVTTQFPMAVRTRFLRIEPRRCTHFCCLQFELLGCSEI